MKAYDALIESALAQLGTKLGRDGLSEQDRTEVTDLVRGASFPALLGLLASSTGGGSNGGSNVGSNLGQPLLHAAARLAAERPELAGLGVSADDVERLLTAVFVHGGSPQGVLADDALRGRLLQTGVQEAAKRVGVPVTPEEAAEVVRLVSTGQFFRDVESTTAAVVFAVRGMPIALLDDVRRFPHRTVMLLPALFADLAGTPFVAAVVLQDLMSDGKLDHPPKVLTHTLGALFGFAGLRATAHTLGDLIRPENKTVRLAIVIYARSQGIPLEEQDLDTVRTTLLESDEPDLGPLLVAAAERYTGQQQTGKLADILRRVGVTPAG